VIPVVSPVHFGQFACSSQNPPILFRGVICHVNRMLALSDVRSVYAGFERSGEYSHFVASPAFWLYQTFAMPRVLPCIRAFVKNQSRSFRIGPPNEPLRSYTPVNGRGV